MIQASIEQELLSKGVKPTAMRVLVMKYFNFSGRAVTLKRLSEHFDRSDESTLYRTLKTFVDKKILHTIDDGSGVLKYAKCQEGCLCAPQDLHFHFHCMVCDDTICLTDQPIPKIQLPHNYSMKQANMVIKGHCENCA